jgi:hypothetical protein
MIADTGCLVQHFCGGVSAALLDVVNEILIVDDSGEPRHEQFGGCSGVEKISVLTDASASVMIRFLAERA